MLPWGTGYVPLQGSQRLHLSVALEYEVIEARDDKVRGPWKVRTRQYRHHVVSDDNAEVVLYHWLPEGKCSTKRPTYTWGNRS